MNLSDREQIKSVSHIILVLAGEVFRLFYDGIKRTYDSTPQSV